MTPDEVETHEKAVLLGLVTGAYIARQVEWPLSEFMRAALLAWEWKRHDDEPGRGRETKAAL